MKIELKNYWRTDKRVRFFSVIPSVQLVDNTDSIGLFIGFLGWCIVIIIWDGNNTGT